jgi:hypothetical protein
MRRRISIRTLMALVAIAALSMAGMVLVKRSSDFRGLAEEQADSEMASLEYAADARGEGGDPQRVARGEQMAAYHRALKSKYEQAARYPWLPVERDPPEPEPPDMATMKEGSP